MPTLALEYVFCLSVIRSALSTLDHLRRVLYDSMYLIDTGLFIYTYTARVLRGSPFMRLKMLVFRKSHNIDPGRLLYVWSLDHLITSTILVDSHSDFNRSSSVRESC